MAYPDRLTALDFLGSRLRGVNGYGAWNALPGPEYLDKLQSWGVNIARVWLRASWTGSAYSIDAASLERMDAHLTQMGQRGMNAVLVVSLDSADMPWTTQRRAAFSAMWTVLAARYAGNQWLAFDLLNEPYTIEAPAFGGGWSPEQFEQVGADWESLAVAVTDAVRSVTASRCVVYEVGLGANPWSMTSARKPLPRPNIVYSPHCYIPYPLTHDQVSEYVAGQPVNPTVTYGPPQQAEHRDSIALVRRWVQGLPTLIGEFSCARWQPANSAALYVADAIEMYEAFGASYCYHEFRGDPVWDAEGPNSTTLSYVRSDSAPVATVLRAALARNLQASSNMATPQPDSYSATSGPIYGGRFGPPAAPQAGFVGAPLQGSVPFASTFTDQSSGQITSRLWTFSDGTTSTATNPSKVWSTAGTFTVSLTVNGPGGSDTLTRTGYVTATAAAPPPPPPPPPVGTAIATLAVDELTGQGGTYPYCASVRLQRGAAPAGTTLQSPDDGNLRASVLSTHDDGSAFLAVVCGRIQLAANAATTLRLQAGAPTAEPLLTVDRIRQLLPTARVMLNVTESVSLPLALDVQQAPTRVWWANQEGICASWVVPAGPTLPGVCAVFVVHAWAGSQRMRVEVTLENSLVDLANPQDIPTAEYISAAVTIGGVEQPPVTTAAAPESGHRATRAWYASGWIGGSQDVLVRMSHTYLQTLPELWRYDQASSFNMAGYAADAYTPWGAGRLQASGMGAGGDHPAIGPLPQWECRALQSGDRRAWRATIASALSALSYNINYRATTGLVPTFAEINTRVQGAGWPRFVPAGELGGVRGWEVAHAPDVGMMAFYAQPSPVFIELAQKAAVWAGTWSSSNNGGFAWTAGVAGFWYQTRGKAWTIRQIAHAAIITPAALPWRASAAMALERNVALLETYRDEPRNRLGTVFAGRPGLFADFRADTPGVQQSVWEHHFLASVLHRASSAIGYALNGNAQRFRAVADWAVSQTVRFIREATGGEWRFIPYLDTIASNNIVGGTANAFEQEATWGQQRAAMFAGPVPPVAGPWRTHSNFPQDYTTGWVDDAVGGFFYVEPFVDALACAVERGVTDAAAAWATVTGNITNWATWRTGFAAEPRWGAAPRSGVGSGWGLGSATGSISGNVWTPGRDGDGVVNAVSVATLQVGTMYEVAGTRMDALDAPLKALMLQTYGQPWLDRGVSAWDGVTDAWVGWAVDERPGKLGYWIGPAGGHAASSNNGLYRFDLRRFGWEIKNLPTPSHVLPSGYQGDTVYPPALQAFLANPTGPVYNDEIYDPAFPDDPIRSSRKPTSRHTYNSQFIRADEGADGTLYMLCRRAWKYDIATDTWSEPRNNQGAANPETAISFENMFAWWDEARGRAYHIGHGLSGTPADRHFWWDGQNSWGTDFPGGPWPVGGYPLQYTAMERRGRVLHLLNYLSAGIPGSGGQDRSGQPFRIRQINLDTGAVIASIAVTMGASLQGVVFPGTASIGFYDRGAVTYIPRLNRYLCVIRRVTSSGDGDELAVIDGATGVCELASTVYGGALLPIGATEGKLRYFEDLDMVVLQPRASRLVRVLIP